jgi:phage baseplate assembly protein W
MPEVNVFASDLDMAFSRNPFSNDVSLIEGEAAIRRAVRSLLQLKKNEKPFHPEINAGVVDLLFEPSTSVVVGEIRNRIQRMIIQYEPRVKSSKVDVFFDEDTNSLKVQVTYTLNNHQKVFTTTVSVERTR